MSHNEDTDGKDPIAVELGRRGGKKGGKARMLNLSVQERRELGRRGALAKWAAVQATDMEKLPRTIAEGMLQIGIPCAVLDDHRRVLSHRGVGVVLGRGRGGHFVKAGAELPFFLAPSYLKAFISAELRVALLKPILYFGSGGLSHGIEAQLLPQIFGVWVKARAAGVLDNRKRALEVAEVANGFLVALAGVGMVALVDEATGYQDQRARDSLALILEKFIAKELRPWIRTFEPEFYQHMFRLQDWHYDPTAIVRPRRAAYLTTDIVYQRLAPGVREELKRLSKRYKEQRGIKNEPHKHRWLTREFGWIKLREHLAVVTALMDVAPSWEWFIEKLDRTRPRYGDTLLLPFRSEMD